MIYPYSPLTLSNLKPFAEHRGTVYVAGSVSTDGTCAGGNYHFNGETYQNVVVEHRYKLTYVTMKGKYEYETPKIFLSDFTCQYKDESCEDMKHYGNIFWDHNENIDCSPDRYTTIFNGEGTKLILAEKDTNSSYAVVTVREDIYVFTIRLQNILSTCTERFYKTDHADLFVQIDEDYRTHRDPGKSAVAPENMSLVAYVNTKFMYLELHIADQVEQLYSDLSFSQCVNHRTTLMNLLTLAVTSPEAFAYSLTKTEGYTAITSGEVVHLIKCAPKTVSYRPSKHCYQEIPITYNGEPMFLTPRNRLIVKHGNEIHCNDLYEVIYNITGHWTVTSDKLHVTVAPKILDPNTAKVWRFDRTKNLAQAGLYSPQEMESLTKRILFPNEREAITSVVVNSLTSSTTDRQGLQFHNLLDEEILRKATDSFMSKIWGGLSSFGNACSGFIGILLLAKILMTVIEMFINGYFLYQVFGLSFRILGACLQSVTTYFVTKPASFATYEKGKEAQTPSIQSGKPPEHMDVESNEGGDKQ